MFNSTDQCFNSFTDFENKQECCNLIEMLAEGEITKFFDYVKDNDIKIRQLDRSFNKINPFTVIKLLDGFKFEKVLTWEPPYGKVFKFTNFKTWAKNVIFSDPNLSTAQKERLTKNPNLEIVLDMSVAFVNNNLNLLNPQIQSIKNKGSVDKDLEDLGVIRFTPAEKIGKMYRWSILRNVIKQAGIGNRQNFPLFPFNGGQHFILGGGVSNSRTEIELAPSDIEPEFATTIRDDLKMLIEALKSRNKTLSGNEMQRLNEELENFRAAEVKLKNKILLINKYIKVATLLGQTDSQIISENKIKNLITEYYENFKEFSEKDLELKGIGSYLRTIINDSKL
jgi:hypothetical protein